MICASYLDTRKYQVSLIEKNKALGRKFLVAGKGGFNLTHAESIDKLILKYKPVDLLKEALSEYDNDDWRKWLKKIGIPTIVGSSRRVYPEEGIKPIEVVRKISDHLEKSGVKVELGKTWNGWDDAGNLRIGDVTIESDVTIFSLGGASWSVTGSDGKWDALFKERGIQCNPYAAANCGFHITWPNAIIHSLGGKPLKNITIQYHGHVSTGEVVITRRGIEGNAIYALSYDIVQDLLEKKNVTINIDLKPTMSPEEIASIFQFENYRNITAALRDGVKLEKEKVRLIKGLTSKDDFSDRAKLSQYIKSFPLEITSAYPLDGAISTLGGISVDEINDPYELHAIPGTYCIGEMVDWWAPTGGYLIQGCVSMGVKLANHLNGKI